MGGRYDLHLTAEGWLYLAVVLDLYSRKVVGWSMSSEMKTDWVLDALNMAVTGRKPRPGLLFHSDRGVQYASERFRARLEQLGIQQSMSRKGNCWNNACVDSFFGKIKQKCCGILFKSRQEARICIFEYIASFCNPRRLHSTLGYRSPDLFERRSGLTILSTQSGKGQYFFKSTLNISQKEILILQGFQARN